MPRSSITRYQADPNQSGSSIPDRLWCAFTLQPRLSEGKALWYDRSGSPLLSLMKKQVYCGKYDRNTGILRSIFGSNYDGNLVQVPIAQSTAKLLNTTVRPRMALVGSFNIPRFRLVCGSSPVEKRVGSIKFCSSMLEIWDT
jgi:hypothetical protein